VVGSIATANSPSRTLAAVAFAPSRSGLPARASQSHFLESEGGGIRVFLADCDNQEGICFL
jgi:hypothetical protein